MKRHITSDPRYDAVGSSSLREELFNTFLKAHSLDATPPVTAQQDSDGGALEGNVPDKGRQRQERMERAVKEREEKIKAERGRVEASIHQSRMGLTKEEGELEFRCAKIPAWLLFRYFAALIR